jgi:hypothetical protein
VQPTFKEFLAEAKTLHMTHAEDNILDSGHQGGLDTIHYIEQVAKMMSGDTSSKINVTTKYDGSPAIFCGEHPENGKFFVGTKGVFSKKVPKIIQSEADADKHYDGELATILKLALTHLSKLNIKGIIQGDLMFTKSILKTHSYDGENYITFTPNTVTYAVPVNSEAAKVIKRAQIGIIFHTTYTGKSFDTLKASFNVDINKLKQTPDVWVDDATYADVTGSVTLTQKDENALLKHIKQAKSSLEQINKKALDELTKKSTFKGLITMNLNQLIRSGKHIEDPAKHVDDLIKFVHQRIEKEKESGKSTPEGAERKRGRQVAMIDEFKPLLVAIFKFQMHVNEAKLLLIRKLEKGASMRTFMTKAGSLVSADGEGFVAVSHLDGKAIKLVDTLVQLLVRILKKLLS